MPLPGQGGGCCASARAAQRMHGCMLSTLSLPSVPWMVLVHPACSRELIHAQLWDERRSVRCNLESVLRLAFPPRPEEESGAEAEDWSMRWALVLARGSCMLLYSQPCWTPVAVRLSCGVCYSFKLVGGRADAPEDNAPDKVCDNERYGKRGGVDGRVMPMCICCLCGWFCVASRCGKYFHRACLADWLRALPNSRRSFHTVFGSCPYCEHPISVTLRG